MAIINTHIKPGVIPNFSGEYRFLSNFWMTPIKYRGVYWKSLEHAYQADKFIDTGIREKIKNAATPSETKKIARAHSKHIVEYWDTIKFGIMLHLLRIKFRKGNCKKFLLATGDVTLEEGNTWGDTTWGICKGKGHNWLGVLLMQVRDELKETKNAG